VTVLALDGTQWAGIAGIVFGLVWLRFFRDRRRAQPLARGATDVAPAGPPPHTAR